MPHREQHLIDGVAVPSVTEVLAVVRKPFLELWRGKHGNRKCEEIIREANEIGREFHEAVEGYFKGETGQDMTQQVAQMFTRYRGWAVEAEFSPTELEVHVESRKYMYHGTADALGKTKDGILRVWDWKSSSMIDELYGCQLAAYAQGYKEQFGVEVDSGGVVRVDKKRDKLEVKIFEDLDRYFKVFLNCLELHKFINGKKNK